MVDSVENVNAVNTVRFNEIYTAISGHFSKGVGSKYRSVQWTFHVAICINESNLMIMRTAVHVMLNLYHSLTIVIII